MSPKQEFTAQNCEAHQEHSFLVIGFSHPKIKSLLVSGTFPRPYKRFMTTRRSPVERKLGDHSTKSCILFNNSVHCLQFFNLEGFMDRYEVIGRVC